jgi:hypothetical protein
MLWLGELLEYRYGPSSASQQGMLARHFQPVPVYHALLAEDGIHLRTAYGETKALT